MGEGQGAHLQVVMSESRPSLRDGLSQLAHGLGDLGGVVVLSPSVHQFLSLVVLSKGWRRGMCSQTRSRGLWRSYPPIALSSQLHRKAE